MKIFYKIISAPFLLLKSLFWNPMGLLLGITSVGLFWVAYTSTPSKRYVGTIVSVSSWDGKAFLKTKTLKTNKDTLLSVHCSCRGERFVVGQVLTVWTGGELFDGIATTRPQE
jgi:hypothetical protein